MACYFNLVEICIRFPYEKKLLTREQKIRFVTEEFEVVGQAKVKKELRMKYNISPNDSKKLKGFKFF